MGSNPSPLDKGLAEVPKTPWTKKLKNNLEVMRPFIEKQIREANSMAHQNDD